MIFKSLSHPLHSFTNKTVWVIGASSGIGEYCARTIASKGGNLILSARRLESLDRLKGELRASYPNITIDTLALDVTSNDSVQAAIEILTNKGFLIDVMLFVSGIYIPIRADQLKFDIAHNIVDTNFLGPLRILEWIIPQFLRRQQGHIALVGSVAGYSGLPKSLIYGPTKAAMINLCETLHYDLYPKGIGVHMISPGFVETPATAKNDFKMPALISAEEAAKHICHGIEQGDFDIHFPKRFTRFLKFLRILPYRIYFWILRNSLKI